MHTARRSHDRSRVAALTVTLMASVLLGCADPPPQAPAAVGSATPQVDGTPGIA